MRIALLVIVACVACRARDASAPDTGERERGVKRAPAPTSRCPEGNRTRLVVTRGELTITQLTAEEAVQRMRSIEISSGRHAGERALPLGVIDDLAPGTGLEIVPCTGDPVPIPRADRDRFALVLSKRGGLKLIDTRALEAEPIVRNVAEVRIVAGK